jgi:glucose dehydrogenase
MKMKQTFPKAFAAVAIAAALQSSAGGQRAADVWPNYQHNSNFSPLTSITPANVANLTTAWTFNYGAGSTPGGTFLGLDYRFEIQPLIIGGVMYISTPGSPTNPELKSTVSALEPETGKVIWQYASPRNIHGRGLAYWPGSGATGPRLYFATDRGYLVALDIKTGKPAAGFGQNGEVDAYIGVVSPEVGETRRSTFTLPNPVAVYRNLLISGARPGEVGPPQPRGDIRAWDAITGKLVWQFHVIPQPGEPNDGTWPAAEVKDRSGANMWSTMTVDADRGIVFAPLADANLPVPGMNLYTASIVALDANTGKLKWFRQLTHHDRWDFDLPTPPILVDVRRNGRVIPGVLQTGKMNFVFIFNRETGEPLYDIEERSMPKSDDPEVYSWPTQPIPVKPGPIGRVGMTRADINKISPEVQKYCTEFWDKNKMQSSQAYWVPMKDAAMVTFPSSVGGPNWGPLSYNPQLGLVFISLHNTGNFRPGASGTILPEGTPTVPPPAAVGPAPTPNPAAAGGGRGRGAGRGGAQPAGARAVLRVGGAFSYLLPSGASIPCYAGPYGELVAVNVNTGEIAWKSTLGIQENLAPLGEAAVKSGTRNIGGSIATASGLVFIGATNDKRFRAFDARTGRELWTTELPASAHSTPVTYMGRDGAQYVVVAAGGGTNVGGGLPTADALVAFKLGTPARR